MAYSSVGRPVFYIDNYLYHKTIGTALPTLDFKPAPAGIDVIKVVKYGIAPIINTSIAHKEAGIGQVGAGMTRAPIECFKKALEAIVSKISS